MSKPAFLYSIYLGEELLGHTTYIFCSCYIMSVSQSIYINLHSWTSLTAQMVKNPPGMRETWVQSLGWEDPLEEVMATLSNILAWRIPMDRGVW